MKPLKNNTSKVMISAVLVGALAVAGGIFLNNRMGSSARKQAADTSKPSYSLNLTSGTTYKIGEPNSLTFQVAGNDKKILKDYDIVHEKVMHLIIVRKDLAEFQHIHPELSANDGVFSIKNVNFTTDGEYRVFADFTIKGAEKDERGTPLPTTISQDIKVGDLSKYKPVPLGADNLVSNKDGFSSNIVPEQNEGGGSIFAAKTDKTISIAIKKDGNAYKNLENYLGALGHMVVLSEGDLEFTHAHALSEDVANQNGTIQFVVHFPKAGKYSLFLQTQAEGKVITNNYTVTAEEKNEQAAPSQGQNPGH